MPALHHSPPPDTPPPAPSSCYKPAHPRRPLSPSCLRGECLLFRPASTDYRKMLTSPIPMLTHVPASPHLLLVTSSWLSSLHLPPKVARRLGAAPRRASSSARNVPFLPRPGRKLSESVSRSTSLQSKNRPIQAARLPAPGPTHLLLFLHPSPNALQDLPSFSLWTLSLIQVFVPLLTTILLMMTMTTNHGENRSLMQNADELGNTPSVSLSEHSLRVCVCVCRYLSILYILQRNAPACT